MVNILAYTLALSSRSHAAQRPVIVLDQAPATLNPRMTLDAAGQRINALLFAALTKLGPDLSVQPDLASSWSSDAGFKRWRFVIAPGRTDHAGAPITAALLQACFAQYASASPRALAIQALTPYSARVTQSRAAGSVLEFDLQKPDPYFPRNATLLRYFRFAGGEPCSEPASGATAAGQMIGSGDFRASPFEFSPQQSMALERRLADGSFAPAPSLLFVRDENTRTLRILRGEAQIAPNSISPVRTRWIASHHADRFRLIEASGVNVSYLAFNLRDPMLRDVRVRRALAQAIPVDELTRHKLAGMAEPATSFLAPMLPDAAIPPRLAFDPEASERLLDEAGFTRSSPKGPRTGLKLSFKTTPVREGYEIVRVIQDAWKRIGVEIRIEVVEPAVFLASIRKGAFQLSLGRWVGVADGSILERTLGSTGAVNRAGYSSPEVDAWLAEAARLPDGMRKKDLLRNIQSRMMEDLPYFPLWFWKNAVLHDRRLKGLEPAQISLSGALAPVFGLSQE